MKQQTEKGMPRPKKQKNWCTYCHVYAHIGVFRQANPSKAWTVFLCCVSRQIATQDQMLIAFHENRQDHQFPYNILIFVWNKKCLHAATCRSRTCQAFPSIQFLPPLSPLSFLLPLTFVWGPWNPCTNCLLLERKS